MKVKFTIEGHRSVPNKSYVFFNSKIEALALVPTTKVKVIIKGRRFDLYISCVHNNSKTPEVNLIKFHRKVNQNEMVCHAQNFGSHDEGQGHSQRS